MRVCVRVGFILVRFEFLEGHNATLIKAEFRVEFQKGPYLKKSTLIRGEFWVEFRKTSLNLFIC